MEEVEISIQGNMGARDDGTLVIHTDDSESSSETDGDDGLPPWVRDIDWYVEKSTSSSYEPSLGKDSMYKVPKRLLRDERRFEAYKPEVVSLGPYHHGEEQVVAMEEHKLRALRQLLVRSKKSVRDYREPLRERQMLKEMMDLYKHMDGSWRKDKEGFVKLMILDGCFMLEVMRIATTNTPDNPSSTYKPIFTFDGLLCNLPQIKRDMLKLENQIPLAVLHALLAVEHEGKLDAWVLLNKMVLAFFAPQKKIDQRFLQEPGCHVLDLVRTIMITAEVEVEREEASSDIIFNDIIWPATQLREAGIKFRKNDSTSLKDISFEKRHVHATLSLPQLVVDDVSETQFLNVMAFEQLSVGLRKDVNSYIQFMGSIIKSDKDASLLSENNIIKNFVGTDQAIAHLFNGLARDASVDPSSYATVYLSVIDYCNDPLNKYRASKNLVDLKRTYFKSPWTFISLIAAILLLLLTILQSVYTVLQYYQPN